MIDHCEGEIPGLLSGELTREEMRDVAQHLRACAECREVLVDLSVAHGSLRTVRRTITLPSGPSALGDRPLPPVVVPKTRQPQWLRAAAALVVVALGVTIGALSLRTGTAPLPVAATAKLASVDAPPSSRGKAIVEATKLGFDMEVETKGLPKITGNEYYEVWLFNPRTNKMLPIGMLKPDGVAHFTFSKSLMDEFSAIDVSLQVNNGVAAHSDISVLRGPVHLA